MDFPSIAAGLLALVVSVLASVLLVFVTFRVNTLLTRRVEEERLLVEGNRSVAVALGAIVLGQAILLRHAVFPTMVVVRDLFLRPVSPGAAAWVLAHVLLFFLVIGIVSFGSVALATRLFARMTGTVPEREEILKGNLAMALFFASVVLAVCLVVNEGVSDLARSLIPPGPSGVVHLD